jgi:hypothetical protein
VRICNFSKMLFLDASYLMNSADSNVQAAGCSTCPIKLNTVSKPASEHVALLSVPPPISLAVFSSSPYFSAHLPSYLPHFPHSLSFRFTLLLCKFFSSPPCFVPRFACHSYRTKFIGIFCKDSSSYTIRTRGSFHEVKRSRREANNSTRFSA